MARIPAIPEATRPASATMRAYRQAAKPVGKPEAAARDRQAKAAAEDVDQSLTKKAHASMKRHGGLF